jgi:hypothetical protein
MGILVGMDCGSDDLDSVMDSSVVLWLQVMVSNDESVIELIVNMMLVFDRVKHPPDSVIPCSKLRKSWI